MVDSSPASLKQCPKCEPGHLLPATLEFFYAHKSHKDGLSSRCKQHWGKDRKPRPIIPEGHKWCPGCEDSHPATLDYFGACKTRHDRLDVYCRPCAHERRLEKYRQAKERGPKEPPPEKLVCSACGIPKPATLKFFTMNPQSRYGLDTTCKVCTNARQGRTPERIAYEVQYTQAHKEQIAARQKRWFQEGGNETVKANTRNRRARLRQAEGKHTAKDIRAQFERQKHKCYYCQARLGTGKRAWHVDHIVPVTRGGSNDPGNLVITCHACNESKNDRLPHEWPQGGRLL